MLEELSCKIFENGGIRSTPSKRRNIANDLDLCLGQIRWQQFVEMGKTILFALTLGNQNKRK
jgi:hypothetical protein